MKLKGGFGNQLFQYAFAKLMERESGETVSLDVSQYSLVGDDKIRVPRLLDLRISLPVASEEDVRKLLLLQQKSHPSSVNYKANLIMESLINKRFYFEKDRRCREVSSLMKYSYFDGYWQSYKYCDPVKNIILPEIKTKHSLSDETLRIMETVSRENSVFLGVRKGDYEKEKEHYGQFDNGYYLRAMSYIAERLYDPVFYVFSNDVQWCKEHLKWDDFNVQYREQEQQVSDLEEFFIMQSCRNAIIINSTFHWWAAYLIDNPDKIVIHPSKWFFDNKPIDIYHPDWVTVE